MRRVVTGTDSDGKAILVSDTNVQPHEFDFSPGSQFFRLWGADETVRLPSSGAPPNAETYFPPVNGFRCVVFTLPPAGLAPNRPVDDVQAHKQLEAEMPGFTACMEPDAPGMHTTDTVDFEYVLSGRAILELDDGLEIPLKAGDTIVQNGTRHAWRNPFDEPCTMVCFMVGALRSRPED